VATLTAREPVANIADRMATEIPLRARAGRLRLSTKIVRRLLAPAILALLVLTGASATAAPAPAGLTWTSPGTIDTVSPFAVRQSLNGVSCPTVSFCVAVDGVGNVLTSTQPTGGAAAWSAVNVDTSSGLTAVSCASPSLCVAVDNAGDVGS
jgi:hypothetical protein